MPAELQRGQSYYLFGMEAVENRRLPLLEYAPFHLLVELSFCCERGFSKQFAGVAAGTETFHRGLRSGLAEV